MSADRPTVMVEYKPFLRSRMAIYRCAMAPRYRGRMLSMLITALFMLSGGPVPGGHY